MTKRGGKIHIGMRETGATSQKPSHGDDTEPCNSTLPYVDSNRGIVAKAKGETQKKCGKPPSFLCASE